MSLNRYVRDWMNGMNGKHPIKDMGQGMPFKWKEEKWNQQSVDGSIWMACPIWPIEFLVNLCKCIRHLMQNSNQINQPTSQPFIFPLFFVSNHFSFFCLPMRGNVRTYHMDLYWNPGSTSQSSSLNLNRMLEENGNDTQRQKTFICVLTLFKCNKM